MRSADERGARWRHYPLPGAALTAGLLAAFGTFRRVVVVGDSMWPTLESGDRLVVRRFGRVRVGDLVAFADPGDAKRQLVKRVRALSAGGVSVIGDNEDASTDSRHFGPVPLGTLSGRAIYRYLPENRRGRL